MIVDNLQCYDGYFDAIFYHENDKLLFSFTRGRFQHRCYNVIIKNINQSMCNKNCLTYKLLIINYKYFSPIQILSFECCCRSVTIIVQY